MTWPPKPRLRRTPSSVEYDRDRLGLLAYYGGWEADVVTTEAIDRDVLAALEELDEEDEDQNSAVQNEQENQ